MQDNKTEVKDVIESYKARITGKSIFFTPYCYIHMLVQEIFSCKQCMYRDKRNCYLYDCVK